MYCHEVPWHKVDRIWTIPTDASQNQLIHARTMAMETAGHEFWGIDGKTVWYDLIARVFLIFALTSLEKSRKSHQFILCGARTFSNCFIGSPGRQ
jgi:hypothetical protein